jgi:D(-)-tartrate dehydratase
MDVRVAAALYAEIANAVIHFSKMRVSIVAVVTDAVVDGEPSSATGFTSNGRYAQTGLLTERLLPLEADRRRRADRPGDRCPRPRRQA